MAFQWVCASSPFGPPTLEFFGNSLEPPPASLRVAMRRCRYWAFDALVCTWPDWVLYAFPPFSIIDRVLLKIFPGTSASPPPRGATPPFGAVVPSAASSFAVGSPDSAHDLDASPTTLRTRDVRPDAPIFGAVGYPLPRLRDLGYSDETLRQLSRSRLASSNATYKSRCRLFSEFCAARHLDPFHASPATISNFLTHIASTGGASVSTLAGYRSAIGHVVRLVAGFDPGSGALLSQLMKSFRRTQPVSAMRIPEWDLSLVLDTLLLPAGCKRRSTASYAYSKDCLLVGAGVWRTPSRDRGAGVASSLWC